MTNNNRIILSLNNEHLTGKAPEKNERWQHLAEKLLVKCLHNAGQQAKAYKQRLEKNSKNSRIVNDAIFLQAARGAGKTYFLENIQPIWEDEINAAKYFNKDEEARLHFCPIIDPTLLVQHDNFTNVVIAHLYNQVERKLQNQDQNKTDYQYFFQSLRKLGEAMENDNSLNLQGIDKIIAYRSGIRIEQCFHDFVYSCLKLLNADAFVLPIDDVDMALKGAFDVLDVVRRLLSCPLIIPIVSGDENLYQTLTTNHFTHKDYGALDGLQARELSMAYLTKVFPLNNRVTLLGLDELIPVLDIKEDTYPISCDSYYDALRNALCPWVNGEEKSHDLPYPTSIRLFVQMVDMFRPSKLLSSEKKENFWFDYMRFADATHTGNSYLVAKAEQLLASIRSDNGNQYEQPEFLLTRLALFNVSKQISIENVSWRKINYQSELKNAFEDIKKIGKQVEYQQIFLDSFNSRHQNSKNIFRSMPTVEFYVPHLIISNLDGKWRGFKQAPTTSEESKTAYSMLLSIYTHRAYYDTAQRTTAQLFFGRAFQLITTNLLLGGASSSNQLRIKYWSDFLIKLTQVPPFHSIYSLSPTKTMFNDNDDPEEESESDEELPEVDESQITINGLIMEKSNFDTFAQKIVNWEVKNKGELLAAQKQGLSLLLICVMNKVFTQLHLIRTSTGVKKNNFENDTIIDMVKRFEYILINAFATFLKPAPVVQQNIALTKDLSNLRNTSLLARIDPSLRDNVVGYIGMRPSFDKKSKTYDPANCDEKQKLLQIIWSHPLFELSNNLEIPEFALGRTTNSNIKINTVQSKSGIKLPDEIKQWLDSHPTKKEITSSDFNERRKIFDDINVFLNNNPNYNLPRTTIGKKWEMLKKVIQNDEKIDNASS